eukprot:4273601-Pleurochrysis_carterae.AAC.1
MSPEATDSQQQNAPAPAGSHAQLPGPQLARCILVMQYETCFTSSVVETVTCTVCELASRQSISPPAATTEFKADVRYIFSTVLIALRKSEKTPRPGIFGHRIPSLPLDTLVAFAHWISSLNSAVQEPSPRQTKGVCANTLHKQWVYFVHSPVAFENAVKQCLASSMPGSRIQFPATSCEGILRVLKSGVLVAATPVITFRLTALNSTATLGSQLTIE